MAPQAPCNTAWCINQVGAAPWTLPSPSPLGLARRSAWAGCKCVRIRRSVLHDFQSIRGGLTKRPVAERH